MAIAFFGGTFDPPHCSHIATVLWLLQYPGIDRVLVVPAARHPFGKEPGASYRHRLEMCRLAIRKFDSTLVEVSDIEGSREGYSYTIDTLRWLKERHPDASFRLAVGSDILDEVPTWHEGEALIRLAPPIEVPRITAEQTRRTGAIPMLSSTDVRKMLADGEDTTGLIPALVIEYIREHQLYRSA